MVIGAHVVEKNLNFVDDQKLGGNDLSFVNVLFILKMDTCFISGISLAKACHLSSVRLGMFRICIRLKLLILEYGLLKPNLFSGPSTMESTLSLLLERGTKVMAFALHPSGR